MIRHYRISFSLIFLVLLASLTFWLDQAVQPSAIHQNNGQDQRPDYILEDISGIRMDHELVAKQTYFAEKMRYYLHDERIYFEQTHFLNKEPDKPVVRVNADHAEILNDGKNIQLTGHVKVVRGSDEDIKKLTMTTSSLELIPAQHLAKTDQPVVITRLNTTVNGVGLEFNNQKDEMKLLSRVRAVDLNIKRSNE